MNTFKKKSLYVAVMAGLGMAGVAGTASAVYVSPDGTGQVLIYPSYTVNADAGSTNLTGFSVTNTGASAKVVKVRFRESKNSREVLDFNLFLSPYDMWSAAVVADGQGAKVITADKSCTNPTIPANGQGFRNFAYTGTAGVSTGDDGAGSGLDRTREGYIEMIELGNMDNTTQIAYVTHGAGGTAPANCPAIRTANNNSLVTWTAPTNELFGVGSILNVTTGMDVTYDATAFADFRATAHPLSSQALGNESPNLSAGDPTSTIFHSSALGAAAVTDTWGNSLPNGLANGSVNAISATIMHSAVMNEFVLNNDTQSSTDWVVTFPTKRYYVQSNNTALTGGAVAGVVDLPFQRTFWNGSCDDVTINFWDREEYQNQSTVDFSPKLATSNSLCWESNIVTFNGGNYLASPNSKNINVESRENGWARIDFRTAATMTSISATPHVYTGLPVIGFMVQDFINNNPGVNASYGGNFAHKWMTTVAP